MKNIMEIGGSEFIHIIIEYFRISRKINEKCVNFLIWILNLCQSTADIATLSSPTGSDSPLWKIFF